MWDKQAAAKNNIVCHFVMDCLQTAQFLQAKQHLSLPDRTKLHTCTHIPSQK